MVHFLQLKFQIAFLILRKVNGWCHVVKKKSEEKYPAREEEVLFIHFVFRHNIISIQILSKCWGYSYLLMLSSLMDRFEGHFPHHPAFSTLISGFRSLKFYWLYKTVVRHIAIFFYTIQKNFYIL